MIGHSEHQTLERTGDPIQPQSVESSSPMTYQQGAHSTTLGGQLISPFSHSTEVPDIPSHSTARASTQSPEQLLSEVAFQGEFTPDESQNPEEPLNDTMTR